MKKGFTLIELIAVLTVLSIIALIVTPNIMVSVQEYKKQAYDTEIQAIESAAKNWTADNISEIPEADNAAFYLSISQLIKGGYFESNVNDPKNGGKFEDENHETFVIITCDILKDDLGIHNDNYKYTYNAYTSTNEYIEEKLLELANDKSLKTLNDSSISDITIKGEELLNNHYIKEHIIKFSTEEEYIPVLPNSEYIITVTRTGKNEDTYKYDYSVTID